jgi:hypothetical protein
MESMKTPSEFFNSIVTSPGIKLLNSLPFICEASKFNKISTYELLSKLISDKCGVQIRFKKTVKTYTGHSTIESQIMIPEITEEDEIIVQDDIECLKKIIYRFHKQETITKPGLNLVGINNSSQLSIKKLLDKSAKFGSLECFRYLSLNSSEIDYDTLWNAFYGGNKEIIQMCLDNVRQPAQKEFHWSIFGAIHGFKQRSLEWIIEDSSNHGKCYTNILEEAFKVSNYITIEYIIKKNINLNQTNKDGRTALFYSDYETSKLLIESGIRVNQTDKNGENALFFSDHEKRKLLIESGIRVNPNRQRCSFL